MFGNILVCLDGSKLAEQILLYATAVARKFDSQVILFEAVPEPIVLSPGVPGVPGAPVSTPAMRREAQEATEAATCYLEDIAERLRVQKVQVETVTIPGGAGQAIVSYAQQNNVGLIAMATHGRTGLGRAVFGSVADHVLHQSGLPIMVVRPQGTLPQAMPDSHSFRKILVCLDGSTIAELVLPYAEALAGAFDSQLLLVRVATISRAVLVGAGADAAPASGEVLVARMQAAEAEAGRYLEGIAAPIKEKGCKVETVVLRGAPVGDAIIDYASKNSVDLISIVAHGHGGLGRAVFGSIADQVLRESGRPILVVKQEFKP